MGLCVWLTPLLLASSATAAPAVRLTVSSVPPAVTRFELDNGLRVSLIQVDNEVLITAYTHLPVGLVHDEAGRALWVRIVERLGTQMRGPSEGFVEPDHVCLRTWSRPASWEETLGQHARMMDGYPFEQQHLDLFIEDTVASIGSIDCSQAALVMFAQGYRFGRMSVSIREDVKAITQSEIMKYRNRRWGILPGTHLTVVSHLPADQLRPVVVRTFNTVRRVAPPTDPEPTLVVRQIKMRWAHGHRACVMAWPVGEMSAADEAGLIAISRLLGSELTRRGSTPGEYRRFVVLPFVQFPGGSLFTVSFNEGAYVPLAEIMKLVEDSVEQLKADTPSIEDLTAIQVQLCDEFVMPNVPLALRPNDDSGGGGKTLSRWLTIRRSWAEIEWRYGDRRVEIGKQIAALTPEQIRDTARKYLTDEARIVCTVRPQSERSE